MSVATAKANGVYYTPDSVVRVLVQWVVRSAEDQLLDPSCGDGRFLAQHPRATGVERDPAAAATAAGRQSGATIHVADFFEWAAQTRERFDCAAGNPPFIRYQRFAGEVRERAIRLCERLGVPFSGLSSSWAPFLVGTASLLRPGGRMAFLVPAEIGHAPYAAPLLSFLTRSFSRVHLIAIRDTVFPELSQDVWLLYAEGYADSTSYIDLTIRERFRPTPEPPKPALRISRDEWERWSYRLRPFVLPADVRQLYEQLASEDTTYRLGAAARVGIGYVTGANDFFHLRPSEAKRAEIPERFLVPTVRNGRALPPKTVSKATVVMWLRRDDPYLLLRLRPHDVLPDPILRYLDGEEGHTARASYKCRSRKPWYVVPDVTVPDGFLSYMSGDGPALVANGAGCACTNSVHAVRMKNGYRVSELQAAWDHPLCRLSTEIEGHPLGGGMLKLEPREAARVVLPKTSLRLPRQELQRLADGHAILRRWRHYE